MPSAIPFVLKKRRRRKREKKNTFRYAARYTNDTTAIESWFRGPIDAWVFSKNICTLVWGSLYSEYNTSNSIPLQITSS